MDNRSKLVIGALATVVATGIAVSSSQTVAATHAGHGNKNNAEKCYGIAKKGMNDCGGQGTGHTCQGQAKKNSSTNDWLLVPKGLCNKIVGGKTAPKNS